MNDSSSSSAGGSDEERRQRLARAIASRRQELGLSTTEAAARASIARNTWMTAESGARTVRDQNFAGIEDALGWASGSVSEVLSGGTPTIATPPRARVESAVDVGHFDVTVEVDRIRHLDLPAEARLRLIRDVLDLYEEVTKERRDPSPTRGRGALPPS